jgi:hypothetical protein
MTECDKALMALEQKFIPQLDLLLLLVLGGLWVLPIAPW